MNALLTRNLFCRALPRTTPVVRGKATQIVKQPPLRMGQFKDVDIKTWTSDQGAYPVIAILCAAVVGSSAYMLHHLFTCNDVRMDPAKRNSVVRTWGPGK